MLILKKMNHATSSLATDVIFVNVLDMPTNETFTSLPLTKGNASSDPLPVSIGVKALESNLCGHTLDTQEFGTSGFLLPFDEVPRIALQQLCKIFNITTNMK
jgi:hypothetical protein